MKHRHKSKTETERCYSGPVSERENPAAHGNICRTETCGCGAVSRSGQIARNGVSAGRGGGMKILVTNSIHAIASEIQRVTQCGMPLCEAESATTRGENFPLCASCADAWDSGFTEAVEAINSTPFQAPFADHADQSEVLNVRQLRGLRAVHECGGLYVIVRERDNAPDQYEIIAENLTAEHARQICDAVNGRVG